jgi:hypothetical protein
MNGIIELKGKIPLVSERLGTKIYYPGVRPSIVAILKG